MSREVRRVPADWQHPKDSDHHLIPLHDGDLAALQAVWDAGAAKWAEGLRLHHNRDLRPDAWVPVEAEYRGTPYSLWSGERPRAEDYMPQWLPAERTHYQMYETTTEGTPISPVFDTPENLARWLADTGASSYANATATYEQWLARIRAGLSRGSLS